MSNIKTIIGAAAIAVVTSTGAFAQTKITIGAPAWTGADAIGAVIKAIIEGPLQGEAEIVPGMTDGNIIFAGMDKGDGSVDVHPDIWMPNQQANWDAYIEEGSSNSVAVNDPYLGTQEMFVPAYMADKVKSMEDLKNPAIAALFDKDGNGKGEYWAGDASWTSTQMWQIKFKGYELGDLWEAEIIPDATFKAQLEAAYNNQKPILFYYWTPEWIHAYYDLVTLEEPPHVEGCQELFLKQDDWLEASSSNCADLDASVYVGYSKSLNQRNPAAAKMLQNIKLDLDTVNGWILKIGKEGLDAQDVAEEWVNDNMDLVNSWING